MQMFNCNSSDPPSLSKNPGLLLFSTDFTLVFDSFNSTFAVVAFFSNFNGFVILLYSPNYHSR